MTPSETIQSLRSELPLLAAKLEKLRQSYMIWLITGIGLASFAVTFALLYISPGGIDIEYTVTFGAFVPSAAIYMALNGKYRKKGKLILAEGLCTPLGFTYRPGGTLSAGTMGRHKILPPYNKARLQDGLHGSWLDMAVDIQEAILTELRQHAGAKKRQKEYVRFWGVVARVAFNRKLAGHTAVIQNTAMQTFFRNSFANYHPVEIGSGPFTKHYEVVTTDTVDAKLVVNAGLREMFMAAAKTLGSYWAVASLRENEALFAFQRYRPFLEPAPLWKPATEKALRPYADDIESLLKIVAVLKANHQIAD